MNDIANYENLANAIILQAVNDYREAQARLSFTPNDKQAAADKRAIERFFRSEWFSILTDLNGELLITKLKDEVA